MVVDRIKSDSSYRAESFGLLSRLKLTTRLKPSTLRHSASFRDSPRKLSPRSIFGGNRGTITLFLRNEEELSYSVHLSSEGKVTVSIEEN